jgi:hypothetical protein
MAGTKKTISRSKKTMRRKRNKSRRKTRKAWQGGAKTTIHYIVSCHGGIVPRDLSQTYQIPRHFEINFYGYQGDILYCTDISPQDICAGNLPTIEVEEGYTEPLYPLQKLFGGTETAMDYYLWPDAEGKFGEIFLCDGTQLTIVTEIPIPETFSALLPQLKKHSRTYFPPKTKVMVHCLFCRA